MAANPPLRLGVNVDHVATVRNARGGRHPDPVKVAEIAIAAGADGITAHLREDRRHIVDDDIARLKERITKPLNFEMAATPEMVGTACKAKPHASCPSAGKSAPPKAGSTPPASAKLCAGRWLSSPRPASGFRCSLPPSR